MKTALPRLLLSTSLVLGSLTYGLAQDIVPNETYGLTNRTPINPIAPPRDPAFVPKHFSNPLPQNLEAKVKSNTQVALPENLFLGDMNGDGIDDFIQVSGSPGAGNHNRILVFGTDPHSTGMMHLYLNSDVLKVFTGNFQLSTEPDYGPDQLCVTTVSGLLNCYVSKDKETLTLMWSQPNFIEPSEQIIVGDFDGNGADDILLYNADSGKFRMITRTEGNAVSPIFRVLNNFKPGDLEGSHLIDFYSQLRAGQWASAAGPDGLIAYNPANGQVTLFNAMLSSSPPHTLTFSTVFTASTNPPSPGAETLSTGRLATGPTDGLVLRNKSTGAYRFFSPTISGSQLTPLSGVVAGQLPVTSVGGPLAFTRQHVNANGSVRDDAIFFNAIPGEFLSARAVHDSATGDTYLTEFAEKASTRDLDWPPVEHDKWLFLRCQFADYPNVTDPLFNYDSYIQNEFGQAGTGLGGFVDFYRNITYGLIDYNVDLAAGWYPTIATTAYPNSSTRFKAASTCAENYAHGITAASFSGANYIGPTYAGIITLWNVQHDGGNDGGNITVLDPSWVGTDMAGAAHEGLHAYGLAHTHTDQFVNFCDQTPWPKGTFTDYCDDWDPMGGAPWAFNPKISTYNLPADNPLIPANLLPNGFYHNGIEDGSEIIAPNRLQLNAIPANRILTLTPSSNQLGKQQATVTLAALEKPEANGLLVVKILHCAPNGSPVCGDVNQFFTVEFRVQTGWDVNIAQATVLIHEVFTRGQGHYVPGKGALSYWKTYLKTRTISTTNGPGQWFLAGEFLPGTTASYDASSTLYSAPTSANTPGTQTPDPSSPVSIAVQSFDATAFTATVLVTY
jgi:hypothetical protein